MRIAIDHRTVYRFSEPQARIVQMLRLTPADTRDQTIVNWHIGVDCDARLKPAQDGFGNAVTMLYAEGQLSTIAITVTGEVLTQEASGVIEALAEPLPAMFYLRSTARTRPSAELVGFARQAGGAVDPLVRMHALNAALHRRFPCLPDAVDEGTDVATAFAGKAATSRDAAQIFVAAARSLGVPARYVSGYHSDGLSHGAPHAWAEAFIDGLGWVGFDSVAGLCPDESYVRVAVGLDATGAAPIAGMRIGQGREQLDVELHAEQLGGDA